MRDKPRAGELLITTNAYVIVDLDFLVRTGLFGPTIEACAEELLRLALRSDEVRAFLRRTP